mmetsp:Transcript_22316/g.21560  ORF Transcript_22316/g.21560 Transcript_22316/m.21560 type:complete len:478 (+) Transcript_22316:302-1735(+)
MGNGSSRQRTMPEGGGLSSAGSARKSSVNSILGINKKEKNSVSSVSAPATVMKKTFKDSYTLTKDLGTGAFSVVKLAIHKSTGKSTAVKIISKKKLSEEDLASLVTEISILCELNHPHIIKCYETFDEGAEFYIVTELVAGGELFDRIVAKTNYTEKEARDLIKMFLETMTYMHEEGVVHRDLKPENLLLCSESDDSDIKIADFGFAKRTVDLLANETACGTPGYVAPEILRGDKYGTEVDIWSMGVICYVLLAGYPPFYDEDQKKLFKKIKEGKYHFHQDYWSATSPDAIDMIKKMLCVNQTERWTARQLLSHAWITAGDEALAAKDLSKSIESLRKYKAKMRFKAVTNAIIMTNRMKGAFKVRSREQSMTGFSGMGTASTEDPGESGREPEALAEFTPPNKSLREDGEQYEASVLNEKKNSKYKLQENINAQDKTDLVGSMLNEVDDDVVDDSHMKACIDNFDTPKKTPPRVSDA